MGNIPSQNQEFLDAIEEGIALGTIFVVITQCYKGCVSDIYEAGRALSNLGAILGNDMTSECALVKL